jgi:RNA polymerase sigma-70 factor (ECF subfamily)
VNSVQDANQTGPGSRSSSGTSCSLIQRVRQDDAAAWDRLISLYAPLVAHWCRRCRLPTDDMADVFQEVFQAVAAHIASFRNDRQQDTFRGWLRTITLNKVHDHFRRRQQEPRAIGGSEALQRFSRVPAVDRADEVASDPATRGLSCTNPFAEAEWTSADEGRIERQLFLRGLDLIRGEFEPRTWQAFWKTAVDGLAAKDVGADLSMSPGAVRVAKSRVLQRLREDLGDLPE